MPARLAHGLRSPDAWRSAVRFAVAITVADALVWWLFRDGVPVVMGSFAVTCMLYYLDYDGSARERLVGYGTAAGVGLVAVALGTMLSMTMVVAVLGAFIVSFLFAYARVLRGYVARAAVGLQGAFFLPLMAGVSSEELPRMVTSWLVGSAVAIAAGMVVLPHRRSGMVRAALRTWCEQAATLVGSRADMTPDSVTAADIRQTTATLDQVISGPLVTVGMVGERERALSHLVDGARWSQAAFDLLDNVAEMQMAAQQRTRALLELSARSFDAAAHTLTDRHAPTSVPDMAKARIDDLEHLATLTPDQLQQHYPARVMSIVAMRMLWLAGRSRGLRYPEPDLGTDSDRTPLALLRLNFGFGSVWFVNALRTAAVTAACVLLVRELGLAHGLWVVLAALSVTQVSFSATTNGASALRVAAGAMAGIALASVGAALGLPHLAYVVLLPITAFVAVLASHVGSFTAQFLYTPFALVNLAALQWASDRDLEWVRLQDVALGVLVALVFALAVFPFGLTRTLHRQRTLVLQASQDYLVAAIASARGEGQGASRLRLPCVRSLSRLESTLAAEAIRPTLSIADSKDGWSTNAQARDRLIAGDACLDLAARSTADPTLLPVARGIADWWEASASARVT